LNRKYQVSTDRQGKSGLGLEEPCYTNQGCGRSCPSPGCGSGDADGDQASQLQHVVERMNGDIHLGRLAPVRARAQPVTDHLLEPPDASLGPSPFRVAGCSLPSRPSVFGDVRRTPRFDAVQVVARSVGSVSAASLGTAVGRGGTMIAASGGARRRRRKRPPGRMRRRR